MQTIGERLEDARKKKGVSIREAAEATKIRGDYLQKFEGNQFDIDLTEIYIRGFLRNYANFLQLAPDRILNDYAALGRGEPRPRQPSREVYGRMDLSISSADAPGERAQPPEPAPAEPARASSPQIPRSHSNLPAGPRIDPALVFKGGIAVVCVLVLLLIYWFVKMLSGGSAPERPAPAASTAVSSAPNPLQAAAEGTFVLVARGTLHAEVTAVADGHEIWVGTLMAGQTQTVSKPGSVYIDTDRGDLLSIEVRGKRYSMPAGHNRAELQ